MLKRTGVVVVSTLAVAGAVLVVVSATSYVVGDFGLLSSVGAAAVVVSFGVMLIALLERANTRAVGPGGTGIEARHNDRDLVRVRAELVAARSAGGLAGIS